METTVLKWYIGFALASIATQKLLIFSAMVNDLFLQMSSSRDGRELINCNIRQLQRGVEWYQGRKNVNFVWIDGVINRMYQFWKLSGYTEAAQAFLKIRDALELTGDFELVENVALKVRTCAYVMLSLTPLILLVML